MKKVIKKKSSLGTAANQPQPKGLRAWDVAFIAHAVDDVLRKRAVPEQAMWLAMGGHPELADGEW